MNMIDPVRVSVSARLAGRLAEACDLRMDGHEWTSENVSAARKVLAGDDAAALTAALAERVGRAGGGPGWMVVAFGAHADDETIRRAAAATLSLLGRPFFSIDQNAALWIGGQSSPERDPRSFGGYGAQGVHIDAPNVTAIPDYTNLLVLQPDPAGGGVSLISDLQAAAAELDDDDRRRLAQPVFFEGRVDRLLGVGDPLLPFPVLQESAAASPWVRWAAKLLDDDRNRPHFGPLSRLAEAVERHTAAVLLGRGQMLIADQQRTGHGRTALGDGPGDGPRRCLLQAKVRFEPDAPAQWHAGVPDGRDDVAARMGSARMGVRRG